MRVVRAMLSLNRGAVPSADALLPTKSVRICRSCGGGHWDDSVSLCHACNNPLGDAEVVNHTFRIENVATQPRLPEDLARVLVPSLRRPSNEAASASTSR